MGMIEDDAVWTVIKNNHQTITCGSDKQSFLLSCAVAC
jgi:hypothetical protein